MMSRSGFFSLALGLSFAAAAPAWAAPAYLTCKFDNGAAPIKVTLDEQAGSASVFVPANGNSFNFSAAFTADKVLFQGGGIKYEIDRVDLRIVRMVTRYSFIDKGSCALEKPLKRAI